jgi:hypothetical protein
VFLDLHVLSLFSFYLWLGFFFHALLLLLFFIMIPSIRSKFPPYLGPENLSLFLEPVILRLLSYSSFPCVRIKLARRLPTNWLSVLPVSAREPYRRFWTSCHFGHVSESARMLTALDPKPLARLQGWTGVIRYSQFGGFTRQTWPIFIDARLNLFPCTSSNFICSSLTFLVLVPSRMSYD